MERDTDFKIPKILLDGLVPDVPLKDLRDLLKRSDRIPENLHGWRPETVPTTPERPRREAGVPGASPPVPAPDLASLDRLPTEPELGPDPCAAPVRLSVEVEGDPGAVDALVESLLGQEIRVGKLAIRIRRSD